MWKEKQTGIKAKRKPLKLDESSSSESEEVFITKDDVTRRLQEAMEQRDEDAKS